MLTLWNARSCPSSARVTTQGMSRYTPLSKLPGFDSLLRGPMHTQCCWKTWSLSLCSTSGERYQEEGGVEACSIRNVLQRARPACIHSHAGTHMMFGHCWVWYAVQAHNCTSSMGSAAESHDSTQAMTANGLVKRLLAVHKECLVGRNDSSNVAATLRLLWMRLRPLMTMSTWHEPGLDSEPFVREFQPAGILRECL